MMLELLRATGCSLEELVALRTGDVDRETRMVRFVSYSEIRQSKLNEQAWCVLDAYLQGRQGASIDPLLCDADGAPLAVERAYEMLLAHAAQVGIGEWELRRLL